MIITGLQKMTLLDFPGKVACTVFLQGCNFRCPFCHNSGLLGAAEQEGMTPEALLDFLARRRGLLDGVCITGGEPTLAPDLPRLLEQIHALGYPVKLDTNGYRPEVLRALLDASLVDYVAMDVKNGPSRYAETAGCPGMKLSSIEESLRLLFTGRVDYELRTTVVEEFHDDASVEEMGRWLHRLADGAPIPKLFLQPFADRDSVLRAGLHTPGAPALQRFSALLSPWVAQVAVRG